jgi:hypothetical protein
VLAVLAVTYLVVTRHVPFIKPPTSCTAADGSQQIPLSVSQAAIATTIAGVAARREMPARAVTIAYAAALQESKLANLDYGDRDSVGVFQQRPSEGWGTPREIEDPVYATGRFFAALAEVPGYLHMPVYQAAQAVQRSADGYAYDQYATVAGQMAAAFTGALPHAVWCYYAEPTGKARLAAADQALTSTFGTMPSQRAGDPAVAVLAGRHRLGWAVAAWLVCHASSYGIKDVSYQGYDWVAGRATGAWQRERARSRRPADPAAVVFG